MPFFSTVTLTVDQLGRRRRAVRSVPSRSFRMRGIKILVAAPDAPVGERVREEPEDPVALGALGGAVERLRRRRAGGLVAQSPPTRPLSSSAATPRCPFLPSERCSPRSAAQSPPTRPLSSSAATPRCLFLPSETCFQLRSSRIPAKIQPSTTFGASMATPPGSPPRSPTTPRFPTDRTVLLRRSREPIGASSAGPPPASSIAPAPPCYQGNLQNTPCSLRALGVSVVQIYGRQPTQPRSARNAPGSQSPMSNIGLDLTNSDAAHSAVPSLCLQSQFAAQTTVQMTMKIMKKRVPEG